MTHSEYLGHESKPDLLRVRTEDGKYEVVQRAGGGLQALRHGEPWRDLTGDGLILALAYELDAARQRIAELEQRSGITQNAGPGDAAANDHPDLAWMCGPAAAVLKNGFSSGPFPDRSVAEAWANPGEIIAGLSADGAIKAAQHMTDPPVDLPLDGLSGALEKIANADLLKYFEARSERENDEGPEASL